MGDWLDYGTLRHFADSWALLALVLIFLGVVLFVFRRGSGRTYGDAARIPLRDADAPEPRERHATTTRERHMTETRSET